VPASRFTPSAALWNVFPVIVPKPLVLDGQIVLIAERGLATTRVMTEQLASPLRPRVSPDNQKIFRVFRRCQIAAAPKIGYLKTDAKCLKSLVGAPGLEPGTPMIKSLEFMMLYQRLSCRFCGFEA
jgi:hypothetical protein